MGIASAVTWAFALAALLRPFHHGPLRLAPNSRQVQPSALTDVTVCDEERQGRSTVCVEAIFVAGSTGEASIECKAFPHDRARSKPPRWADFVGSETGRRAPSQMRSCDTSAPCEIYIQQGLAKDTRYDVFCLDWSTGPPYESIHPECPEDASQKCGVQVKTDKTRVNYHDMFGVVDLVCVLLLASYICWSFVFERVHILHETGLAMLVGLVFGVVIRFGFGKTIRFSYSAFSYVLLPMVIFAAGYNLQKKSFFRHVGYIFGLGVLCTVLIFMILYFLPQSLEFRSAAGTRLDLSTVRGTHQRLVMASVLSSTDCVAPIAFLPMSTFPHLNAVVFGESILNDVVAILLSISAASSETRAPALGSLALDILYFMATSGAMGIGFGLSASYAFKRLEVLHHETLKPCFLLLLINYACYIVAEMFEISSIFSLFVCALLSAHYARHSLSPEARLLTRELAEFMSYGAEAFVFGYFGLTAVGYLSEPECFSWTLILFYTVSILVARFLAVGVMAFGIWLSQLMLKGRDRSRMLPLLSVQELCVVALAGCMRGSIAYALVLRAMPPEEKQTRQERVLVSTVLGVVLINCLVFGTLFPVVMRLLGLQPHEVLIAEESHNMQTFNNGKRLGIHHVWHEFDARWMKPIFLPQEAVSHRPKLAGSRVTIVGIEETPAADRGAGPCDEIAL